jgi:hypothetical protein
LITKPWISYEISRASNYNYNCQTNETSDSGSKLASNFVDVIISGHAWANLYFESTHFPIRLGAEKPSEKRNHYILCESYSLDLQHMLYSTVVAFFQFIIPTYIEAKNGQANLFRSFPSGLLLVNVHNYGQVFFLKNEK